MRSNLRWDLLFGHDKNITFLDNFEKYPFIDRDYFATGIYFQFIMHRVYSTNAIPVHTMQIAIDIYKKIESHHSSVIDDSEERCLKYHGRMSGRCFFPELYTVLAASKCRKQHQLCGCLSWFMVCFSLVSEYARITLLWPNKTVYIPL